MKTDQLITALAADADSVERPIGRTLAIAGLAAAGIGATLYGTHCPDDSPFFVCTWYVIASGFMALLGAAIGERVLRW